MIAENVKVSVFGKIGDGLHSAYISTSNASNKSAYVVSRKNVSDYFDGVVIAVAKFNGLDGERPVVAPYG